MSDSDSQAATRAAVTEFSTMFQTLQREITKFIAGQDEVVERLLIAIVAGGHVLLEGVPGLGKTALVSTAAKAMNLNFKRIQFTPDLLPADLLGTHILLEQPSGREFVFQPGPIFTNLLLADEINRATPKTQSALLEVMQERTVTVGNQTHRLALPYFVLATQNPLEMDGTYPLPEAQLDRFFFKLCVGMPPMSALATILERTAGVDAPEINPVADGKAILRMGEIARQVPIADSVRDYLLRIILATHPEQSGASAAVRQFVRYGASIRAAQTVLAAARIKALLSGRYHVAHEDIDAMVVPAMRHRIILNFEGQAADISIEEILQELVKAEAGKN